MKTEFKFDPRTTRYDPYNAYLLAQIAGLAYRCQADSSKPDTDAVFAELQAIDEGFKQVHGYDANSAQGLVVCHEEFVVVAFRGTDEADDWLDNLKAASTWVPMGRVHRGFKASLADIWPDMARDARAWLDVKRPKPRTLWITGHSLGGAMATLCAAELIDQDRPFYGVYTFGQPRVGDRDFARAYNIEAKARSFRFQNNNDMVTRVPARVMGYSHVGTFIYIDTKMKLSTDMHWWYQFLDGVQGAFEHIGTMGIDGVEDHGVENYVKALKKNLNKKPKGYA